MVSIGDGEDHLSYILDEHERKGTRSLGFEHPEHGAMIVRQMYDISTESFRNLDITFKDPVTGEVVTERYPSSRFVVQVDDTRDVRSVERDAALPDIIVPDESTVTGDHTRVTPSDQHRPTVLPGRPSDPISVPQLPPSEPGRGRELTPNHTGGNQTDLGSLTELAPGFPAQEQEPQIYINPDQSDDPRFPSVLFAINAAKDKFAAQVGRELRKAFSDIEAQTEIRVWPKQRRLLKRELQSKAFWERLNKEEILTLRRKYEKSSEDSIAKWEEETNQNWPTFTKIIEKNGKKIVKKIRYQVHHIIPLQIGGAATEWWNMHPAKFPDQHQGGLHRAGGPLNKLTK